MKNIARIILMWFIIYLGYTQEAIKLFVGDEAGVEVLKELNKSSFSLRLTYYNALRKNKYDTGIWGELRDPVTFSNAFDISIWYYRRVIAKKLNVNVGIGFFNRVYHNYYRLTSLEWVVYKNGAINTEISYPVSPKLRAFADFIFLPRFRGIFDIASPYNSRLPISKYFQVIGQI